MTTKWKKIRSNIVKLNQILESNFARRLYFQLLCAYNTEHMKIMKIMIDRKLFNPFYLFTPAIGTSRNLIMRSFLFS